MTIATVYFAPEHNAAAIEYDRSREIDLPVPAINHALEMIYSAPGDLGPFIYEAWNGDDFKGLVISEPFGAQDYSRILLEFDRIVQCNKEAPELEEWAPKHIEI